MRALFPVIAATALLVAGGIGLLRSEPEPGPPAPVAHPAAPPSVQASAAATVHPVTADELGSTWRPECPVGPDVLRRVALDYLGFDGRVNRGSLVVHRDVVDDVIAIFAELRQLRYPIEKMQTVDRYRDAEDELSMRDNNTSAFNCRPLPGGSGWSRHAYGLAIDINPLVNPYLDASGDLQPATAGEYLDRTRDDLGLLHAGDAAVRVFTDRGWRWGGAWRDPVDYQHFEFG